MISYQNNNQKLVRTDYIYRKNQKGKPWEMDLPLLIIDKLVKSPKQLTV